jgi:sulfur-oxidizing protein SoxZ
MADNPIVIRAKHTNGITKVRVMITHPMIDHEDRDKENSNNNRPNFIQDITCFLGEETVMSALCSGNVGRDPFLAFDFEGGNKGDTIRITWVDNRGERGFTEVIVS